MGTIICRHRNHTLFDRLSDYYSNNNFLAFHWYGVGENRVLCHTMMNSSCFSVRNESNKLALNWFQAKTSDLESPKMVLKDVHVNDNVFISLCGHICNASDYEKKEESVDFTELLSDISSKQEVKNKIIHFNEIPSYKCFYNKDEYNHSLELTSGRRRVTKYNKERLLDKNRHHYGVMCPLVEDGYYENISFYDDNVTFYNPSKKFIQINHAVTRDDFFDRDGYLCSTDNYKLIDKEEVVRYEKMFLFLI